MKIGIVGNGGIVQQALHCLQEEKIEMTALWCRNGEKGKPLCDQYQLKLYTDYEAFLKDDSYDTVYIGLINSLHYEYAMKAVEAKKNVIVEKPFTSRYAEAVDLINAAEENGVMLFEAIMSRYSRNYDAIITRLDEIGDIKLIQANYSQYSRRYDAYQKGQVLPAFDPKLSGGALYDINVYNVHFVTGLFGSPRSVQYFCNKGPNGIDTSGTLILDYQAFKAILTGAKDSASPSGTFIQGTEGTLIFPERPGVIRNVQLQKHDNKEPEVIDTAMEGNAMNQEFRRIAEVVDKNDTTQAAVWMMHTRQAMSVLDQARVAADIHFAADDVPLAFSEDY